MPIRTQTRMTSPIARNRSPDDRQQALAARPSSEAHVEHSGEEICKEWKRRPCDEFRCAGAVERVWHDEAHQCEQIEVQQAKYTPRIEERREQEHCEPAPMNGAYGLGRNADGSAWGDGAGDARAAAAGADSDGPRPSVMDCEDVGAYSARAAINAAPISKREPKPPVQLDLYES